MPRCRSAPRSCRSLHHPAQPCHQAQALIYTDYQRRSSTWVLTSVHRRLWMMLTSPWSPIVLRCSVPPNSTRTSCSSCSHPPPPPAAPAAGHRHPSRLALPVSQAARTQALHAYASLPPTPCCFQAQSHHHHPSSRQPRRLHTALDLVVTNVFLLGRCEGGCVSFETTHPYHNPISFAHHSLLLLSITTQHVCGWWRKDGEQGA